MTTGTALYYPFIHPRNPDRLKAALIYWDRVRRIVPESLASSCQFIADNDYECQLLEQRNLLISTDPEPYEDIAAQRFFECIDRVDPAAQLFRIDPRTARYLVTQNRFLRAEKFGQKVLDRLIQLGMAHRFGVRVSMRAEVSAFYLVLSCI